MIAAAADRGRAHLGLELARVRPKDARQRAVTRLVTAGKKLNDCRWLSYQTILLITCSKTKSGESTFKLYAACQKVKLSRLVVARRRVQRGCQIHPVVPLVPAMTLHFSRQPESW